MHVLNEGTRWRATITDYGSTKQSVADHALQRIEESLLQTFALAD